MLATRKRTPTRRKVYLPLVEQLEDRCVFNAAWQAQLPSPVIVQTEVVVVVVTWNQAPVDTGTVSQNGLGRFVSAEVQEGFRGLDLALFIHQFQVERGPVSTGDGDDGGATGDNGGGDTGNPGLTSGGAPTPGSTGTPGVTGNNGGSGTGSSHGTGGSSGSSDQGSGSASGQGTTVTPAPTSGGGSQTLSATPTGHADAGKAHTASSTATAAPTGNTQTAALSAAALAVQSAPTGGEAVAANPVGVRHELVARADFHPEAVAAALNSPGTSNAVRIDYLPGGTEQPAYVPRAQGPGSTSELPLPPKQTEVPPTAPTPAAAAKTAPATPGAQDKAADTGAEPQEAGVLTKVPMSAVPPLGLDRALRRLKDLLADLTTSRALLHVLPVTGALAVMGGAAFGLIRWRRKKRLAKNGVPDDVADDEEKDTWLPGSGSLPPVDPV